MATSALWWKERFGVERTCTCRPHARGSECSGGWHLVDSFETEEQARRDAAELTAKVGVPCRAVDQHTRRPLAAERSLP